MNLVFIEGFYRIRILHCVKHKLNLFTYSSTVTKDDEQKEEKSKEKDENERGQLTKAMLQNIVASIDTKEASKLLERATRLLNSDDGHKLSLKQLLGMISHKKMTNNNFWS